MDHKKCCLIILLFISLKTPGQDCQLGTNSSFSPQWSHDGQFISFHNNTHSNREIYLFNIKTSQLERLTHSPDQERVPVMSPDGTSVLFFRTEKDRKYSAIFSLDLDSKDELALTALTGQNLDPAWSPDMSRLTFVSSIDGNWEIHTMNPSDSASVRRLTHNPTYDYSPHWSPDGKYIGYVSQKSGQDDIWIMRADGDDQRNLTPDTNEEISFSWSPDGTKLLYSSRKPKSSFENVPDVNLGNASNNSSEIYLLDLKTTEIKRLTTNDYLDVYPSWSPDGRQIAYCSCKTGHLRIYLMDINGNNSSLLLDKGIE